jgi:hypothetical protein
MFIAILTLLSALSISAIAAFYSIVGLATIFPGAYWPVIAMGSALEVGKLVCASWLYRNWHNTNRGLRSYLFASVIILCLITSMGIFGFLSKAHLETKFQSSNNSQQISIINSQIKAEQDVIDRQTDIIKRNSGAGGGSGERIAQLRDKIKQLDKEVEAYTSQGSTSTIFNDKVAKGIELKNQQKAERDRIDAEIRQLTTANQGNNSAAESQIARSQQRIQQLINQRAPLQSAQIKIDAEIGPIKYIGALAVDVGLAKEVDVEAAVRWVIIIIIFVFDPLAVLMLVAANQSFASRFPTLLEKPKEIIDLERPDLDPPPAPEPKNNIIDDIKKKYETQLKEWREKLEAFNSKVEKIEPKKIEIVPINDEKKTEDLVSYTLKDIISNKDETSEELKKKTEELDINKPKNAKPLVIRTFKAPEPAITQQPVLPRDDFERKGILNKFHQQYGKFKDASDVELKQERDDINRERFLEAVFVTEEDARNHPPITKSRMRFFTDYIDDILRGDTTAENLPPDIAKTCAILLSEHQNPQIVEPQTAGKPDIEIMTTEALKEKFMLDPEVEDREITEQELDKLLDGFKDEEHKEFDLVIQGGKKIRVPKSKYVQNEEQKTSAGWSKIKELDLPEPEKNEILLPTFKSIDEKEILEIADEIKIETQLPKISLEKHKKRLLNDEQYREKIEQRVNDLITKIETGEIKLKDLSIEDQTVIAGLMKEQE